MKPDRPLLLYVLDDEGHPIGLDWSVENTIMWGRWCEAHKDQCMVQQDDIGPYFVSTVFLASDHNHTGRGAPILWETMVFTRDRRERLHDVVDCRRYRSVADAKAGHLTTCQLVRVTVEQQATATTPKQKRVTKSC